MSVSPPAGAPARWWAWAQWGLAGLLVLAAVVAWAQRLGGDLAPAEAVGVRADAVAGIADELADGIVEHYRRHQRPDGGFGDPVRLAPGDYGTAMLGLAMARRGVERRDQGLVADGVSAMATQAGSPSVGAFELLALTRSYRWGERTLLGEPFAAAAWTRSRRAIAESLGRRTELSANPAVTRCIHTAACYGNHKLVAALASATLLRAQLAAPNRQALLARPEFLRERQRDLLDQIDDETPADVARAGEVTLPGAATLSDPPQNPLAYHALSVWMLGQLLEETTEPVPLAAREAFLRAGRGVLALAAPDGDLSYYGRGQGQLWVPAVTAAAAARVAALTADRRERAQAIGVAAAALRLLRGRHRITPQRIELLPGAATAKELAARGYDDYAGTRIYSGLAVHALDDAARVLKQLDDAPAAAPPSASAGTSASRGSLPVATLTGGGTWVAVGLGSGRWRDARYGPGVLELRRATSGGRWTAFAPPLPMDGPLLPSLALEWGGERLLPVGSVATPAAGSVVVRGSWRSRAGTELPGRWRWTVDGRGRVAGTFRAPCACRLVAVARAATGDRVEPVTGGVSIAGAAGRLTWLLRGTGVVTRGAAHDMRASAYGAAGRTLELSTDVRPGAVAGLTLVPDGVR